MKISNVLVLALLSSSLAASGQATSGSLRENSVFQKNCAKCHGKTAEGRHFGGPSLISAKTASLSSDELRAAIVDGKGRMPKFAGKLSDEAIATLVSQIAAANGK